MNKVTIHQGHVLEVLAKIPGESFHACITDPPYELGFMGKTWDKSGITYDVEVWREVLRVLKPGAHLLAFGGSRTYHRLVCAIEDAGFEIRDQIMWLYGSGFPKSLHIGKAVDKLQGNERKDLGKHPNARRTLGTIQICKKNGTGILTKGNSKWEGWGTALKPAVEPLVYAQKPYTDKQLCDIIGSKILNLEAKLWSLLPANVAEKNFKLSRKEYAEVCASAQWSAEEKSNTQAALSALMDMSQLESVIISSLNIVWLWQNTWREICSLGNTSTTETELIMITDLKTLNCSLSGIMPLNIIRAALSPDGWSVNASPAGQYFSGELLRLRGILSLSAQGSVTSNPPTFCPDADAKPYSRPIVVARKPLEGTVVNNVLKHGCGGLNVDGCRISINPEIDDHRLGGKGDWASDKMCQNVYEGGYAGNRVGSSKLGRWPANVIHDGSDEVVNAFPQETSKTGNRRKKNRIQQEPQFTPFTRGQNAPEYTDGGNPARFFYCAKASPEERNMGLEGSEPRQRDESRKEGNPGGDNPRNRGVLPKGNFHPTVKPLALMRYLCRLVTPPGGVILDCFAGSGSTLIAAGQEGFDSVGIDIDTEYCQIAAKRLKSALGLLAEVEVE